MGQCAQWDNARNGTMRTNEVMLNGEAMMWRRSMTAVRHLIVTLPHWLVGS